MWNNNAVLNKELLFWFVCLSASAELPHIRPLSLSWGLITPDRNILQFAALLLPCTKHTWQQVRSCSHQSSRSQRSPELENKGDWISSRLAQLKFSL